MAEVTIYTRPLCGFCLRAVKLLQSKGAAFTQIDAGFDPRKRAEMLERSGGAATYPQIFIGERHVGGCDELMTLEEAGELDALLTA